MALDNIGIPDGICRPWTVRHRVLGPEEPIKLTIEGKQYELRKNGGTRGGDYMRKTKAIEKTKRQYDTVGVKKLTH